MGRKKRQGKIGANSTVLDGHVRVGKIIKSSILMSMGWHFTSYIDDTIPEVIIFGLLNDRLGYRRGAEVALHLTHALRLVQDDLSPIVSQIARLSTAQFADIASQMGAEGSLHDLSDALTPFVAIFPQHPLRYFCDVQEPDARSIALMRACIENLYDRYSMSACAALAALYYVQSASGRLHIAEGLRVPKLDSIISDPESEDALHASSSVRMYAQSLLGQTGGEASRQWSAAFWNACYLVTPCEFEDDADDRTSEA